MSLFQSVLVIECPYFHFVICICSQTTTCIIVCICPCAKKRTECNIQEKPLHWGKVPLFLYLGNSETEETAEISVIGTVHQFNLSLVVMYIRVHTSYKPTSIQCTCMCLSYSSWTKDKASPLIHSSNKNTSAAIESCTYT